jgi:hypothetical protein
MGDSSPGSTPGRGKGSGWKNATFFELVEVSVWAPEATLKCVGHGLREAMSESVGLLSIILAESKKLWFIAKLVSE